ncbi:hypothetical protein H0B43_13055 [Rhodococcus wratislaviensis]|nr:hypothetical protein [Rhodococcus sp. 4CII]
MQVAGGWMGDRALAPRAMVLFGAAAIMTGHVTLSLIPGIPGLVAGLAFITVGTGALEANITAIIGATPPEDRSIRDAGFSYFDGREHRVRSGADCDRLGAQCVGIPHRLSRSRGRNGSGAFAVHYRLQESSRRVANGE